MEESKDMEMLDKVTEARDDLRRKSGKVEYELSGKMTWMEKTYEKLTFDFEGLTGRDMESIDEELAIEGVNVIWPVQSRKYQRLLAARAAGVPSDMLEALPLSDYNHIISLARNFLLATG